MRGPEWEGRDQDGGEEFVGTVVAVASAVGSEDHNDRGAGAGTAGAATAGPTFTLLIIYS